MMMMSLIELNKKAWNESDKDESQGFYLVGHLKWPSREAFNKALKELYDSVKPIREEYEEKK